MKLSFDSAYNQWNNAFDLNNLQVPFLTYNWHKLWFNTIGRDWKPLLFRVGACIAPFAVKDNQAIFSGGYETADYLDIIGPDSEKKTAWEECISILSSYGIQKLNLRNIPQNSATVSFLKDNFFVEYEDSTPIINLPNSWEEYVEGLDRKSRHELRRKIKKFKLTFPHSSFEVSKDKPKDILELFRLMKFNPQKAKFLTPEMEKYLLMVVSTFTENCILLLIKDTKKTVSAALAFNNENSLFLYNSGFDETEYSGSGFYLKSFSIKYCIDRKLKLFNFLQGREKYKYELGGKDFYVYKTTIML